MVATCYLAAASTLLIGLCSAAPKPILPRKTAGSERGPGQLINYQEWLVSTGQAPEWTLNRTGLHPRDSLIPKKWPNQEDVEFPIPPWPRSCKKDAERALWSWRDRCDRDQAFKKEECFNSLLKPPSSDLCCFNDQSVLLDTGSCLGSPFWPLTARAAAICTYNCDAVTAHSCDYGDEIEINNPKHICECMVEGCILSERPFCAGDHIVTEVKRSAEMDEEWEKLETERRKLDHERALLNEERKQLEDDHANEGHELHGLMSHNMEDRVEAPAASPTFDHGKL